MQYTRIGNTGLVASRLAFGVMTFGHEQEVTEIDALTGPAPLYPNWFQAFATDAVVRDALQTQRK